jgi:uncharacterized membrane protein
MNSLPLHPAIVHLPLALAILMPLFAAGVTWAMWTGRVHPRAWLAIVGLQALLLGSGLLAINTGGAEEERVEAVIREGVLHQHEEFAEQFVWAIGITLALTTLVLVLKRPGASHATAAAVVVATVAVAGLGLRVGHAGGQLVYVHGAASAYAAPAAATSLTRPELAKTGDRRGDRDDDEDRKW